MGAPTWPPSPRRSERPGAAVALLWAGHWARWGPDMAPKPPTFGAPRRSRGAPQGRALGEMGPRHGPQAPNVRSAPAQPWRSSGPGTGRDGGLDMGRPQAPTFGAPRRSRGAPQGRALGEMGAPTWGAPKPPTFGAPRRSRGGSSGPGTGRDGGPDMAPSRQRSERRGAAVAAPQGRAPGEMGAPTSPANR